MVADPEIAVEVLKRPREFMQTEAAKVIMGQFGENLIPSDGDKWKRMRRAVQENLNEKISSGVWEASRGQADDMLDFLVDVENRREGLGKGVTRNWLEGLKKIAINVLGNAGYGAQRQWREQDPKTNRGYQLTYILRQHEWWSIGLSRVRCYQREYCSCRSCRKC